MIILYLYASNVIPILETTDSKNDCRWFFRVFTSL